MTKIEWTEATWNPIVGCSVISPGCTNCYAMKMAARLEAMGQPIYQGLTKRSKAGPVWTGELRLSESALSKPFGWRKPRMVFVNSMSDLFHESVPDEWIDRVVAVMALTPQHTYQVLTKRSARMREYASSWFGRLASRIIEVDHPAGRANFASLVDWSVLPRILPNVWLGVSAEDQIRADERIPDLLATSAAVRFVSAEPLLGPIDFKRLFMTNGKGGAGRYNSLSGTWLPGGSPEYGSGGYPRLDWIIVGGESGSGAREFHTEWAQSIVDQCRAANTAVFVKQLGARAVHTSILPNGRSLTAPVALKDRKGGNPSEWPQGLRVREMPRAA